MTTSRGGKRDVALTTLIDLLVQVVFIFTLLLIASGAIEGAPEERGFIAPEAWKTLVSIFDVDPKKKSGDQAKDIEDKYRAAQQERDSAIRERDSATKTINNLDAQITELKKGKLGAPGYPPCRARDGEELFVLAATIESAGRIAASPLPGAKSLDGLGLSFSEPGQFLSRQQFQQAFSAWREHGMSRDPKCKYIATVRYDPRAAAGDYQPSISAISSIFRIQNILRQGER